MKIIIVSKRHGRSRTFNLSKWRRALISACILGLPVGASIATHQYIQFQSDDEKLSHKTHADLRDSLVEQESKIDSVKQQTAQTINALTLRLAELQARIMRIDALGERLTQMADLDKGEFDFSVMPPMGGPEQLSDTQDTTFSAPDFYKAIDQLSLQIDNRQQQLSTLEALLENSKLQKEVFVAGRPIKKGWMSSRFGHRTDPFTGRKAWHAGVDFAGKTNSDIIAVASGVVTWSGERSGYGQLIEVNHGNGYKTRYAHCKELLVNIGDVVKKGQVVALMGSSGRSTGPHVHFEVFKHGRPVDPARYIHRVNR